MKRVNITTAMMVVIAEALFAERNKSYERKNRYSRGIQFTEDNLEVQRVIDRLLLDKIKEGVTEREFYKELSRLDFLNVEERVKGGELLKLHNEDLEHYFPNKVPGLKPANDSTIEERVKADAAE